MHKSIALVLMTLSCAASSLALDLNVDLGLGSKPSQKRDTTWSIAVCRTSTEAKSVKIEVAEPGKKERDTLTWDRASTREAGSVQELAIPGRFRDLGKIWVQATAEPKDSRVSMSVLHEGQVKRVFSFQGKEKHDVSINDPEASFDCPKS